MGFKKGMQMNGGGALPPAKIDVGSSPGVYMQMKAMGRRRRLGHKKKKTKKKMGWTRRSGVVERFSHTPMSVPKV